jgi:hypothetical protein
MIGGQLRDGRRMLFRSGTDGAFIDPSDGLEKRSHMFGRFRTRAVHPPIEVHFSRFCPLTIGASGASLFVFDGAATHHPPLSVTDAEQPLIVALRASINSYPATSRETIGDAHADPQSPRRHKVARLVIVRTAPPTSGCTLNASTRTDR